MVNEKFSTKWKKSKQVRKKHRYIYNLPLHLRHKLLNARLNKELKKQYNRRSFSLRKGDIVKIIKGKHKKKTGKINRIDLKKYAIFVDGIQITKKDGSKVSIPLKANNLQITELNLEDKKRISALKRKAEMKQEAVKIKSKKETKEKI